MQTHRARVSGSIKYYSECGGCRKPNQKKNRSWRRRTPLHSNQSDTSDGEEAKGSTEIFCIRRAPAEATPTKTRKCRSGIRRRGRRGS